MQRVLTIMFFVLTIIAGTQAQPATKIYKFDVTHSNVQFSISHFVISEVAGTFAVDSGVINTTGKDFNDGKIEVWLNASSVNTRNDQRDAHLRSADFFNVAQYPAIHFKSTSMKKMGNDKYKVSGDLTMHGVTKQIFFEAYLKGTVKSPFGNFVTAFKASADINRTQWGLTWNRTLEAGGLAVGENVHLNFDIEVL